MAEPMRSTTIEFTPDKETPGTMRFNETGAKNTHTVGTLYIKKSSTLHNAMKLRVTIEAVE